MNKCTNRKKAATLALYGADCKCGNCVKYICFSSSTSALKRSFVWASPATEPVNATTRRFALSLKPARSPKQVNISCWMNKMENETAIIAYFRHISCIYNSIFFFSFKIWNCLNSIPSLWPQQRAFIATERLVCQDFSYWDGKKNKVSKEIERRNVADISMACLLVDCIVRRYTMCHPIYNEESLSSDSMLLHHHRGRCDLQSSSTSYWNYWDQLVPRVHFLIRQKCTCDSIGRWLRYWLWMNGNQK